MNQKKIKEWLKERHLVCEENFGEALYRLALDHSEKTGMTLTEIWRELGITRQNVNYWMYHQRSTMSQLNIKRFTIEHAKKLFLLSESDTDLLAKKAGIKRLDFGKEEGQIKKFICIFSTELNRCEGKQVELYKSARLDKRTFYRIKSGKNLRKETLLSVLLVMNLSLNEIKSYLELTGYVLSSSLPVDIVLVYLLQNDLANVYGAERLDAIIDLLHDLGEPWL